MSAGTLTLANNSDVVAGIDTSFTTDLSAGDFIVVTTGGVTYTLPVKTIESDTALTLARNYNGPAVTAGAWTAMPRDTLNRISAQIAADTAYIIRQRVLEVDNWYQLLEVNGDVVIKMADGSTYTGPSWRKITGLLEVIDESALQAIATQVHSDAVQVATDKTTATQAAAEATQAKTDSQTAKSAAEAAASDAGSFNESAAQHASDAEEFATTAMQKAKEAANSAASVHPENLLQNANNLDDLTDKPAARQNLDVFSREEIADMLPGYLGQIDWQEMRTALEPGTAPRDGQEVDQTGIFADLYAKAVAGKLPTCTEAEWQADPLKRGCYVLTSSPGKMRLPDDNGTQPGSLKIPVHVGDGGVAANNGKMGASALPNVKGHIYGYSILGGLIPSAAGNIDGNNTKTTNALNIGRNAQVNGQNQYGANNADANYGSDLDLNLSRNEKMYQDGVTEIRPNRVQGCWTVRFAAKATNGGSIDALALATAIASGDSANAAAIAAVNARLDYALLDFGTMARSERKVLNNPFGANTPVEVVAEIQRTDLAGVLRWTETGWIYNSGNGTSFGTKAGYLEGVGVVVQCGSAELANTSVNTGMPMQTTNTGTGATSLPVRVHVRKITA
ncbi:hypothetical protein [Kluyvera cryocrescens]|uniref:hypothetical protein n=1 Tax=Kluyvera cryocrescens TaxID=580 RepID=UPI000774BED1|nr:hypothetical protein [Kluyvera cryocrescens]